MQHIVIVGGTSGIGLALAKYHLAQDWEVTVVGSSDNKIANLPDNLSQHPNFNAIRCDISDEKERKNLLAKLAQEPFNRLIYCAGKYYNERKRDLDKSQSQIMLSINLQAFHAIFAWASEQLKLSEATPKQLIAIASIAGLLDFEEASLYAKCKRAMIAACDAYRLGLDAYNIQVNCIACGYIDTAQLRTLNYGDASHKPHIISEREAVTEIIYAIDQNIGLYVFPKVMKRTMMLLALLPKPILSQVMKLQYHYQDQKVR